MLTNTTTCYVTLDSFFRGRRWTLLGLGARFGAVLALGAVLGPASVAAPRQHIWGNRGNGVGAFIAERGASCCTAIVGLQ